MADDKVALTIDGATYELAPEDLELGEVELLEEELGASLDEIDFTKAKAMRVLVFILVSRERPQFTMDDARKVKVASISEPEVQKPAAKRPTKAAAPASG